MQRIPAVRYPGLLACVCLCVSAVFFLGAATAARAQSGQQAEITSFSGTVEVLFKDEAEYVAVEEGMTLEAGDTLKTGSSSSVELSFNADNSNLVRLSENTTVRMTLSVEEKLEMTDGEVFATVSSLPSGSSFEIRTPTAVSGARGTDWVTTVSADGTDVEAVDSQPYVRHFEASGSLSRQFTPIQPGQMTTVRRFQQPGPMRPISGYRQQQWQTMKQQVRQRGGEAMVKRQQRPEFNRQDFLRQMKQPGAAGKVHGDGAPGRLNQAGEKKRESNQSVFKPLDAADSSPEHEFKPLRSGDHPSRPAPEGIKKEAGKLPEKHGAADHRDAAAPVQAARDQAQQADGGRHHQSQQIDKNAANAAKKPVPAGAVKTGAVRKR